MSQGEMPAYQRRSRENREKIVRALDEALKEKPFDQVSVAELAERAGVAVGTVYQRFKNKEALIPVILEIYRARLEAWAQGEGRIEIEPKEGLRAALRKVMRQAWTAFQREAHLLRAVHINARLHPELVASDEWDKYAKAAVAAIKTPIKIFEEEVERANVQRATAFAAYVFNSIMIEKGLYPDETPGSFFKPSGRAFADECADMLYAYLTLPEA